MENLAFKIEEILKGYFFKFWSHWIASDYRFVNTTLNCCVNCDKTFLIQHRQLPELKFENLLQEKIIRI
jgi:hypothetical protein